MPFEIVRNDITKMRVHAIVNTANPHPIVGAGTDAGIHAKAGPRLLEARKKIGGIEVGHAAITPGFDLPAKYVIHTVGPAWKGGQSGEEALLRQCYLSSLALAAERGCKSVAFPLISTGTYGFPKDLALQVAIGAISQFLLQTEMKVYLVVFNREAYRLSEQLFRRVASYIDEHYVEEVRKAEYVEYEVELEENLLRGRARREQLQRRRQMTEKQSSVCHMAMDDCIPPSQSLSLEDLLRETDEGFSERLQRLIKASGKKASEIYARANVTKQHFSKIINQPNYQPKKATAVAFAIALKLDLEQTRDLIGRAGYALTNSSKFDVIIRYFIENKQYDIHQINIVLYDFDQPTLGV